ncbi:RdgB/HAM1 family non-canonical purine NTP pyrophosphatase [Ancrocorticia populi]|uniref:dITP/XTP pyrophosphatase n=1 Tax=Ancrocorticia populi TaxID=2175228 RepID=A0A2V1KBJ1_9ACTO|nr:RdgB/HAM1 family non-canonical purine NTP pyrophosphatase [Ancrocorticia populi]MDN6487679.1 RdgB/HAM1 family non-canonical purine NTP pyrophosphatase [Ancrocorticia sp.]PWF27660.1 non-canonical purine NTP pyrophosphatase, RdgB/HAM1 family [Ancrocorticia populi]
MRIVLGTRNEHKVAELRNILQPLLADLDVIGAREFDLPEPVEDEVTFAGNALIKARQITRETGLIAIADDSGICVDAMGGAPGVFSARWSGKHGDDDANLQLLLHQMGDVPDRYRGAEFRCAAALVTPDGVELVEEGVMRGTLMREKQGANGFGYDPIFMPEGLSVSSAEISPAEKDAISHRGKAFRALAPHIASVLGRGA